MSTCTAPAPASSSAKGGEEIKAIEAKLVKMIGKPVDLKIVEVRNTDMNAQLVAENIAQQLEKRIGFRRAMKNAMGRAMRAGAAQSRPAAPAVWAALRSPALSTITTAPFPCRPCVPISITASLRLPPPTAASA